MATRRWVEHAQQALRESLGRVPAELNELDWKAALSPQRERLVEHLIAMANLRNGGTLVLGIDNEGHLAGVDAATVADTVNQLANLGRDAVEPPLAIDHAVIELDGTPVLLVHVPEQPVKPAHRRGRPMNETWVRSGRHHAACVAPRGGRADARQPGTPRWEQQRASSLLSLDEVQDLLDLSAVAGLLQRPLPAEPEHLAAGWPTKGWPWPMGAAGTSRTSARLLPRGGWTTFPRWRASGAGDPLPGHEQGGHHRRGARPARLCRGLRGAHRAPETGAATFGSHPAGAARGDLGVPEIALRELIANALIHQDFSLTGTGPMIELFDDRIEFSNPGRCCRASGPTG
jgi:ATP-dependent DNA helicase RecG